MAEERLQKIIARAGLGSRRGSEEIITGGRVRVNGKIVTELGTKADPRDDKIEVDGKRLVAEDPVYVAFHKPRNVVSTMSDPEGRPTVADHLKAIGPRVYPVGRLDFATSGILLCTNDGDFANGLLHPRREVPKTYVVKTLGQMTPADLERWKRGVELEDGRTLPAEVRFLRHEGDKTWFEITIKEGRNQQIRRMGDATGFRVMRLARLSFAEVTSDGLRPGQWRHLDRKELVVMRELYGVPKRIRPGPTSAVQGARMINTRSPSRSKDESQSSSPSRSSSQSPSRSSSQSSSPSRSSSQSPSASRANPWRDSASTTRSAPPGKPRSPARRERGEDVRSARNARSGKKPRGAD